WFLLRMLCHSSSTLFPYTTLFRSVAHEKARCGRRRKHSGHPISLDDGIERLGAGMIESAFVGDRRTAQEERREHDIAVTDDPPRSEEHTSELQSRVDLVCRLLLEN